MTEQKDSEMGSGGPMIARLRPVLLEALGATSAYIEVQTDGAVLVDGVIEPDKVIRALLGAMRSLPEGVRLSVEDATGLSARQVGDAHRAMIDAALSDPNHIRKAERG